MILESKSSLCGLVKYDFNKSMISISVRSLKEEIMQAIKLFCELVELISMISLSLSLSFLLFFPFFFLFFSFFFLTTNIKIQQPAFFFHDCVCFFSLVLSVFLRISQPRSFSFPSLSLSFNSSFFLSFYSFITILN